MSFEPPNPSVSPSSTEQEDCESSERVLPSISEVLGGRQIHSPIFDTRHIPSRSSTWPNISRAEIGFPSAAGGTETTTFRNPPAPTTGSVRFSTTPSFYPFQYPLLSRDTPEQVHEHHKELFRQTSRQPSEHRTATHSEPRQPPPNPSTITSPQLQHNLALTHYRLALLQQWVPQLDQLDIALRTAVYDTCLQLQLPAAFLQGIDRNAPLSETIHTLASDPVGHMAAITVLWASIGYLRDKGILRGDYPGVPSYTALLSFPPDPGGHLVHPAPVPPAYPVASATTTAPPSLHPQTAPPPSPSEWSLPHRPSFQYIPPPSGPPPTYYQAIPYLPPAPPPMLPCSDVARLSAQYNPPSLARPPLTGTVERASQAKRLMFVPYTRPPPTPQRIRMKRHASESAGEEQASPKRHRSIPTSPQREVEEDCYAQPVSETRQSETTVEPELPEKSRTDARYEARK